MEELKEQIQNQIKAIPSCELKCLLDMKTNFPLLDREGYVALFNFKIPCGPLKDKKIIMGIEIPSNDFPRLPPHFIHFKKEDFESETIKQIGDIHQEYEYEGEKWMALSRPPQDIWDDLDISQKNLKAFFYTHLQRFWEAL